MINTPTMKTRKAITMIISVLFLLKCAVLTMVFFITGCAIKSSQLKEINNRVNEKDTELRPFAWRLMWNQYEKVVYSVDLNPVYLFGNINGDAITIDNFNLQEAQGLGRFNYLWQFIEKDGSLRAYESGQLRETYQCSEWSLQETKSEGVSRSVQRCNNSKGTFYQNIINFDADRSVTKITYDLFGGESVLVLERI